MVETPATADAAGTYALDVIGEFTAAFMYAIQDRERVQNIVEELTGQRLMFNYFRLGGVAWDVPEPRAEFFALVREFLEGLPRRIEEYHDLLRLRPPPGRHVRLLRPTGLGGRHRGRL